jgi:hypothetical protein
LVSASKANRGLCPIGMTVFFGVGSVPSSETIL